MIKPTYTLYALAILASILTGAHAQTPPPLEVTLSEPVSVQRTITVETSDATVEWLLLTPGAASITAKIQPLNREVKIQGVDYSALVGIIETKVREGKTLRAAFAEALQPHIQDSLAP